MVPDRRQAPQPAPVLNASSRGVGAQSICRGSLPEASLLADVCRREDHSRVTEAVAQREPAPVSVRGSEAAVHLDAALRLHACRRYARRTDQHHARARSQCSRRFVQASVGCANGSCELGSIRGSIVGGGTVPAPALLLGAEPVDIRSYAGIPEAHLSGRLPAQLPPRLHAFYEL